MRQNDIRDEGLNRNAQGSSLGASQEIMINLNKQIEALTALTAEVKGLAANAVGTSSREHGDDQPTENAKNVRTIDLVGFIFRLFEKFWIIALAAIVGTVGAWFYSQRSIPVYSATAKMYIVSPGDSLINFSDLQLGTVLTLDYQEVFQTWEVHEMVREDLNLNYSYAQLQSMISVTNPEDTRILYVSAINPDPQLAADIANSYARAAKVFITQNMRGEEPTDFSIALVPGMPINSSGRSTVIKGFLLGSVLVVALLFLQYVLDDRPQTPDDIMNYAGIPTLAILPSVKMSKRSEQPKDPPTSSR